MMIEMLANLNDEDFVSLAFIINAGILVNRGSKHFIHQSILYGKQGLLNKEKQIISLMC